MQAQHNGRGVTSEPQSALPPQQGILRGSIARLGQPLGGAPKVGQYFPDSPLRKLALYPHIPIVGSFIQPCTIIEDALIDNYAAQRNSADTTERRDWTRLVLLPSRPRSTPLLLAQASALNCQMFAPVEATTTAEECVQRWCLCCKDRPQCVAPQRCYKQAHKTLVRPWSAPP